jgi:hypothetical protein
MINKNKNKYHSIKYMFKNVRLQARKFEIEFKPS